MTFSDCELQVAWGAGVPHDREIAAILEATLPQTLVKLAQRLARVDEHHGVGLDRFRLGSIAQLQGLGMPVDLRELGANQGAKCSQFGKAAQRRIDPA